MFYVLYPFMTNLLTALYLTGLELGYLHEHIASQENFIPNDQNNAYDERAQIN
jgi:hypothetical protein